MIIVSFGFAFDTIIKDNDHLTMLQVDEISIGCIKKEYPWCQGSLIVKSPINKVLEVVEDVEDYYKFFDSLSLSKINDKDEVRIRINMPLPFTDRDYTVFFNMSEQDNEILYSYKPVISNDYPVERGCVRLINAQGEWYLKAITDNKTLVKYTWNGQMLGNFPHWAYKKAWIQQGNEILSCLSEEVERRKNDKN